MADPGELAARLTAELDERLAAADAALARATRASGRGGSRCTRSTCRPTGTPPTWRRRTARRRSAVIDEHADAFAALRRRRPTWCARVGPSSAASRSRTCGSTSRTATSARADDDEDADVVRAARARWPSRQQDGTAAPFARDPDQVLRGADPGAGASRTLAAFCRRLLASRRHPRRLRGDAAEGDQRRPGRGDGARCADRGGSGWRPARCGSRSRSRRRSRSSAPTAPRWSRGWCTPAASRLTGLHYGTYDYSAFCGIAAALPVARAPGRRPRQAGHAGRRGGHRRPPLRRLDQRAARSATPTQVRRGWAQPPPAGAPVAGARLLPGLGPAPGPAADAVRRDVRLLPRRASPVPPTGSPTTSSRGRGRHPDEPATARALADFLLRGLDCGALLTDDEPAGIRHDHRRAADARAARPG